MSDEIRWEIRIPRWAVTCPRCGARAVRTTICGGLLEAVACTCVDPGKVVLMRGVAHGAGPVGEVVIDGVQAASEASGGGADDTSPK